jgi:cytoskeleton protein RodZ
MLVGGSDAPRAGADLRAARERLGWALPDVAAMLRIRPSYLGALEAGRLNQLPGTVYAMGFLRSYSTALGLDADEMVRRVRAEAGEIEKRTQLVFPSPVPERGLPAGALILLGLILAGGAYAYWYHLSGEGRLPAETVAPVPARLATLAEQALPGPDGHVPTPLRLPMPAAAPSVPPRTEDNDQFESRRAAIEAPARLPEPPPAPPPAESVQSAPMPGGTPTTAIAMPVIRPIPQPEAAPQSVPPAPPDLSSPDTTRVVLRFTGDTWVQVKERGGQVILTKVMKAGDSFAVPARPNLILTTGNAGRVDVMVDGTLAPSLGGAGTVRKDVPLEADLLRSGLAVPAATHR